MVFSIKEWLNHFPLKFFVIGVFLLVSSNRAFSQIEDTSTVAMGIQSHSPQKAVIYSIICPGLGQIYNKKYWKLPFIYGAGGTLLYYIGFNHLKYTKFRNALYLEYENQEASKYAYIDGHPYRDDALDGVMKRYRRWRDECVFGFCAIYLLNVIDAMVDAQFLSFDVSDDLSLRVEPVMTKNYGITASIGFRINLEF
jgi:Family of unknown function (DUF5683)